MASKSTVHSTVRLQLSHSLSCNVSQTKLDLFSHAFFHFPRANLDFKMSVAILLL